MSSTTPESSVTGPNGQGSLYLYVAVSRYKEATKFGVGGLARLQYSGRNNVQSCYSSGFVKAKETSWKIVSVLFPQSVL